MERGGVDVSRQAAAHAMELRAKYLVLLLLAEGPKSGYELLKVMKELIPSTGRAASPGTIYPLLKRLEEEGCVESVEETSGGRKRKVYRLTAKGVETLLEMVARGLVVVEALLRLHLRAAEKLESARIGIDQKLLAEIASKLGTIENLTKRLRRKIEEAYVKMEARSIGSVEATG